MALQQPASHLARKVGLREGPDLEGDLIKLLKDLAAQKALKTRCNPMGGNPPVDDSSPLRQPYHPPFSSMEAEDIHGVYTKSSARR